MRSLNAAVPQPLSPCRRSRLRSPAVAALVGLALALAANRPGRAASPRVIPAEGFVVTRDGVHLYYEILGAGSPTIVVSGGFLVRDALAPLARSHRVVFYDARGRGRSDAVPPERTGLERQLDDVDDLTAALGIDRMVLLGWSGMGKEMALYTLRHPDRVERLLQVAPVPPVEDGFMERMMAARSARMDGAATERLYAEFDAGKWDADPAGFCRANLELDRVATFSDPANAVAHPDVCRLPNEWPSYLWRYFSALLPSIQAADPTAGLRQLRVPRLVIVGAEDAVPLDGVKLWVDGYAEACLLVLPGAGHWPFVEAAQPFFAAAETFLAGRWPASARGLACADGSPPPR